MKELQKNTKVLYLVNHIKTHGGVQRMLCNKIDAWVDEFNYDVTVVTLYQDEKPIVYPVKNHFKLIDLKTKKANQHHIIDLFRCIHLIDKVIRQESPDVIITTLTGIPSLILPLINPRIKKILRIASSGALSVSPSWKYKWMFLNRYYKVVLLNEDEKQYYKLNNLTVIPNFISLEGPVALDYNNRKKRIVAAGRIHSDKQYLHLIQAWEIIFKEHADWSVEIYGDGDQNLLKGYQKYIEENDIRRIQFKPATDKIENILASSSLFCLTSETENFPNVLVECKKAMLPAVSYDSPNGPRHIIKDDGVLVEHNNIEKFAEEVGRLIENEELRSLMARNAYRNRTMFSSSEIIKKWNELI